MTTTSKPDPIDDPASDGKGDDGLILDGLAALPEKTLIDDKALGKALGRSDRSIRRMTERGEIPPGIHVGGRTLWIVGRVIQHLEMMAECEEKKAAARIASRRRLEP